MTKSSNIFLFSKTAHPDVNHIPILDTLYLQPSINFYDYDYIIATSKEVFSALEKIGSWKHIPILATSEPTANAARECGAKVLEVADGYGKGIVALVKEKYSGLKGLYPHAKVVAFDIEKALAESDIFVDSCIVYETFCSQAETVNLPTDAICIFTSPSSVKCFEEKYTYLPTYRFVCIGETTRLALPEETDSILAENTSVASAVSCAKSLLE